MKGASQSNRSRHSELSSKQVGSCSLGAAPVARHRSPKEFLGNIARLTHNTIHPRINLETRVWKSILEIKHAMPQHSIAD